MFAGVRWGDVALAVVLAVLGAALMVVDVMSTDPTLRVDSHSWLVVPVFVAATLPILWRRRGVLAVSLVTTAVMAVHVLAFGAMVRCGAGLPLAFALAYGVGRLATGWRSWVGLVVVTVLQVLVLVQDTAAGLDVLPVTAGLGLVAWGIGVWVRRRAADTVVPAATASVASPV